MNTRKIYLRWSEFHNRFTPTGMDANEDVRRIPKQGYGVCEIAAWLSSDLPNGIESVDIWIKNLTDLSSGKTTDGNFGMGNAHWVMVTQNKVFIGCEHAEEQQVIMTNEQILYILEQYKTLLESDDTNSALHPEPIDVEYIAEGKEAIALYESLDGAYCLPY